MVAQRADELIYDGPDGEALAAADERDLTIAFKSGSDDAYSVIYGRYRPRVESVCRRMLGNRDDAQEATQEAFLRVFQSLHSFNGRYQLGAWITRIATNVCLDALRAQARKPSLPTPMDELELTLPDKGIDSDPEFFVIRRAESRRVRRVLESLPPMHRAAIILRDFEGLSYSEVAIALGITDAQVKALLHRARTGFKRAWNPAAVASMFLPARFVDRFRKVEGTVSEHANYAAKATPLTDVAASASHAAASCGGFIQACGVVVTERFATAAAAVVVTAGAVAGVGGPTTQTLPAQPGPHTVIAAEEAESKGRAATPSEKSDTDDDEKLASGPVVPTPTPSPTPNAPKPTPSPTPSPTPPPGGGDNPAPTPLPVQNPYFGFSNAAKSAGDKPLSSSATVDCDRGWVSQEMTSVIHHGDEALPMAMTLDVSGNVRLGLTITKDGQEYYYDGGAPTATLKRSGQRLQISFFGSYSYIGQGRPGAHEMPDYGQFAGNLTLDCFAATVAAQDATLYVQ